MDIHPKSSRTEVYSRITASAMPWFCHRRSIERERARSREISGERDISIEIYIYIYIDRQRDREREILREIKIDRDLEIERSRDREMGFYGLGMFSGDDNVGVVIVAERAKGEIPGYIGKSPCRIWIQRTTTRRGGRGRRKGNGKGKDKKEGGGGVGGRPGRGWMVRRRVRDRARGG